MHTNLCVILAHPPSMMPFLSALKRSILDHCDDRLLILRIFFALAHTMLKALYAIRTIGVRGGSIPSSI